MRDVPKLFPWDDTEVITKISLKGIKAPILVVITDNYIHLPYHKGMFILD